MSVPEYRPYGPHLYPLPEPEKAGKDSSKVSRQLLALADEIIAEERDSRAALLAVYEASRLQVRELRAEIEAKDEQIAALTEHVQALTEAQTEQHRPQLEVAR